MKIELPYDASTGRIKITDKQGQEDLLGWLKQQHDSLSTLNVVGGGEQQEVSWRGEVVAVRVRRENDPNSIDLWINADICRPYFDELEVIDITPTGVLRDCLVTYLKNDVRDPDDIARHLIDYLEEKLAGESNDG